MVMQDRKLKRSDLDTVGKQLFATAKLTETEIDRIAAGPSLFGGVLARIAAEPTGGRVDRPEAASFLSGYKIVLGTSLAAVLCVGALGIYLQQSAPLSVSKSIDIPAKRPDPARPVFTPQVKYVKGFTEGRADISDQPAVPEQTSTQYAIQREPRRSQPRVERATFSEPRRPDFIAVTYTGDGGESARGGRVVRVDVPRSTLFAMGFDVSLENDSPTVKADLLIGPDGVTRAVRLVE